MSSEIPTPDPSTELDPSDKKAWAEADEESRNEVLEDLMTPSNLGEKAVSSAMQRDIEDAGMNQLHPALEIKSPDPRDHR